MAIRKSWACLYTGENASKKIWPSGACNDNKIRQIWVKNSDIILLTLILKLEASFYIKWYT